MEADLAIVATGRSNRLAELVGGPVEGGPCGLSYLSRMYTTRPGQEPIGGEQADSVVLRRLRRLLFPHDAGTHSVLWFGHRTTAGWR